jgi:hypothetical protein
MIPYIELSDSSLMLPTVYEFLKLFDILALDNVGYVLTLDDRAPLTDPVYLLLHLFLDVAGGPLLDEPHRVNDLRGHRLDLPALGVTDFLECALQLPDLVQVLLQQGRPHLRGLPERGQEGRQVAGAGVFEVADRVARMLRHTLDAKETPTFQTKEVQRLSHMQLTQFHYDDYTVRLIYL